MNNLRKYFSTGLLAAAALCIGASPALAQVSLGAASEFSVLGGTNVTCTAGSVVTGDVGVSPGSAVPFTNTGCVITGETPPETNADAARARAAFLRAYTALQSNSYPCTGTVLSTITGPMTLTPGTYCTGAALTGTGVLTLDGQGNRNAVWIFKIGTEATGALTGTNFTVVMANGGQACNVYWVPSAAVTMTTSALKGNILAGNATDGSVTMTGGTLAGRVLANVAVTMTGASVIGCDTLSDDSPSCKGKRCHNDGKGHKKCDRDGDRDGHDRDHDDKDKGHGKDKGHDRDDDDKDKKHGSDDRNPFGSKR